jgi:hypothetical protein
MTRWDSQRIVKTLRQLHHQGNDISYTGLSRSQQALVSAAAYHFGSYRKAIQAAGLIYSELTRRPRWTRAAIIAAIKTARRAGHDLHWGAVVARGDDLTRAAFAALQKRLFGSWGRALAAAGLDADDVARYRRWDRNTIVQELKQRRHEGEFINSGQIQAMDPGLHAAAVRHFGSYDLALEAAGIAPGAVRRRRRWNRDLVLRELQALHQSGVELCPAIMRDRYPALYRAAQRFFGNIAAAAHAAGNGQEP